MYKTNVRFFYSIYIIFVNLCSFIIFKDLSGDLRKGFHDLLIKLHLESFVISREMTKHEFVIPLCDRLTENNLDEHDQTIQKGVLPSKDNFLSVRPEILKEEDIKNENQKLYLVPPKINLDSLKNYALNSFCDSVKIFSSHIRDPIGGSTSSLFV